MLLKTNCSRVGKGADGSDRRCSVCRDGQGQQTSKSALRPHCPPVRKAQVHPNCHRAAVVRSDTWPSWWHRARTLGSQVGCVCTPHPRGRRREGKVKGTPGRDAAKRHTQGGC